MGRHKQSPLSQRLQKEAAEPLDRLTEAELCGRQDEIQRVPARAAAEAVPDVLLGVDEATRRSLLMDGA